MALTKERVLIRLGKVQLDLAERRSAQSLIVLFVR